MPRRCSVVTSTLIETGDMMVVTCHVPCNDLEQLSLSVFDHMVSVEGPDGFRHELELPAESDMRRLSAQLYKGILELRAPRLIYS
jgi:HSP20 family molecular chaperone IbpA